MRLRLVFAAGALWVALGSAAASAQEATTGLTGQVVLASRCPVPLGGDDTTCPTVPLPTSLAVRSPDGSTEIASVATDAAGQFSVPLDPGQYLVVVPALSGRVPTETLVTVIDSGPTLLTIQIRPGPRTLP
jgi:hypothetical protein